MAEPTNAETVPAEQAEGSANMCPHCGEDVLVRDGLTTTHDWPKPFRQVCPGSGQHPRCSASDARPLWSGPTKPHLSDICPSRDREPQPSDGPDYHADHAAWRVRNDRKAVQG